METSEKTTGGFFNSLGFKLATIGALSLLLLIPAAFVRDLIREREQRRTEAIQEVSAIWGNSQTLTGPFLSIPYHVIIETKEGKSTELHYAHFLPDQLNITGKITPEVRKRGIFKIVTYKSQLHFSGTFSKPQLQELVRNQNIIPDQAFIEIGIPDMRGLKKNIRIQWNDTLIDVIPGLKNNDVDVTGVHGIAKLSNDNSYAFSFDLDLNGSYSMNFVPIGKDTRVTISSTWPSPSFKGAFIPEKSKIDQKGFTANWNVLQLNRTFPQQWIDQEYTVQSSAFGVELITPVDAYQKSERSAKYAILFIGLTFLVFFFAEIMTKTRIHIINYLLSGFALCVFYSLLIALAEHIPFNLAYLISGATIITMIGVFSKALYQSQKVMFTITGSLVALYLYLFIILQLNDYSLLFGNIGLVVILGTVMYFSRKIDWYGSDKNIL